MTSTVTGSSLATNPLQTLDETIDTEFAELDNRRAALVEMRSAVLRLRSVVTEDPTMSVGAEPVVPEDASAQVSALLDQSDNMVRTCVLTVDEGPGTDDGMIRALQERITKGLVQRALYPLEVAETTTGRRWMASWAAAGEQQRVTVSPPSEFAVFGSYAVFATRNWGEVHSGYVLIRSPMVVTAFASLFDAVYADALPVPGTLAPSDDDSQLIEMLGLGMKDEAIARYLGWGLRTVRRRVARLMAIHDVDTRYQLGAAVATAAMHNRTTASTPAPARSRAR